MIVDEIKIGTGESIKTVKELRKELKDLRDQLLSTEQGTEEYNAALQQAANIQKELKDQMMELNNTAQDFGQVVGNVTGTLAGMAGAVTAVTGTLSLFGIENEEAQKKITATMTALIGITQGLSRMDSGIKAFRRLTIAIQGATGATSALSKALISTGIGALVVAVGTLAANWDKVKNAIGGMIGKQKDLTNELYNSVDAAEALKKKYDNINDSLDFALRLMQAQGATNAEVLKEQERQLIKLYSDANSELSRLEDHYANRKDAWDFDKKEEETLKKRLETQKEIVRNYSEQLDKNRQNQKIEEARAATAERERQKAEEERKRRGSGSGQKDDPTKKEIESIQARLQAFEDAMRGELAVLEERYKKEKELFEKNNQDITLLTKEYEEERKRIIEEAEQKIKELRIDNAIKTTEAEIKAIEATARQKKIEVDFDLRLENIDAKTIVEQIDNEKKAINAIFDIENTALKEKIDALNGLLAQLDPGTEEFINTQNEIANATIEQQNLVTQNYIDNKELESKKDEEVTQLRISRAQQTADAMNGIADVLGVVSDVMQDQVEQELKNGKITDQEYQRKMKVVKGMQIAMTTIQMLTGIATALSGAFTTKSGPWDIALAAIQAASIAASGIASIVKIKQTEPDGATGSASSYVPSISIPSVVTSSGDFTQSVDGALTQTAIEDQRVFVLEHDITETQKKVEVAESRAVY